MKNKIYGLIICILLLASAVFPVIGITKPVNFQSSKKGLVLDYPTHQQSELGERDKVNNFWVNLSPRFVGGVLYKREFVVMTYDSGAERTILFGGGGYQGTGNDTWAYDYATNTWVNRSPKYSGGTLSFRSYTAAPGFAYDPDADRSILFGGIGVSDYVTYYNETWAYNYTTNTWVNRSPNVVGGSLTPRSGVRLVYYDSVDRMIMFGGYDNSDSLLNETWEYNYNMNTWTNLSPAVVGGSLPKTADHGLVYDSTQNLLIYFGGYDESYNARNETWAYCYSNNTWWKRNPSFVGGTLDSRIMIHMVYDSSINRTILFGGNHEWEGAYNRNDTWMYNYSDNTWYNVSFSVVGGDLYRREAMGMAYDSNNHKTIMACGWGREVGFLNDTWVFMYNHENHVPNNPTKPSGPTWLNLNEEGTYNTNASDPDMGDMVQFQFDWDASGSHDYSDWTKYVASGTQMNLSHSWKSGGTYVVKAQARDLLGNKSGWSKGLTVVVNKAPNKPQNPNPPDTATNVDANVTLSWNCNDPDGDQLFYDVYFEENNPNPNILVSNNQSENWYDLATLKYSSRYYWRIVAWDEHGISKKGDTWSFSTIFTKPTVGCSGILSWTDVNPRSTITGSFTISNIGEFQSLLDWKIIDWPKDWGSNWAFTPLSGDDLKPSDGAITINVSVRAPNEKGTEFTGKVTVINTENSSDLCTIDVSLVTPKNKPFDFYFNLIERLLYRFPLLQKILDVLRLNIL